jgi:hypothetical protein
VALTLDLLLHGNLIDAMKGAQRAAEGAVTTTVRRKTTQVKNGFVRLVRTAKLGRLEKTVHSRSYPESPKTSMNAKGIVYSTALYKRPGGLADLLTVWSEGSVITPTGGKSFLAIPLGPGGRGPGQRRWKTPGEFPKGTFRFVPSKTRPGTGLLYFKRGGTAATKAAAFFLIPLVGLHKRLNFQAEYDRALANAEEVFHAEYERRMQRVTDRVL